MGSKLIKSNVTIFQQYFFRAFFSTNDVTCRLHYDVIYHPSRIQFSIFRSLIITLEMPQIQQLLIHLFERKFGQTPAKYGLEENADRNMVLWL